jgi:hypothetical protein
MSRREFVRLSTEKLAVQDETVTINLSAAGAALITSETE